MTKQPEWILVNEPPVYLDGCALVFIDRTGDYAPEIEVYQEDSDSEIRVYRVILEPHTHVCGVLSDNPLRL